MEANPLKILIIRFSSLGDLVLLSPLLEAVSSGLPSAEIHVATKERYAELFRADRRVGRLFTIGGGGVIALLRLIARLREERYDIIIDAHNVARSNIIYRILKAPKKVQLKKDQVKKGLLITGKRNLYDSITHQTARYLDLAGRLGLPAVNTATEIAIPQGAEERAAALITGVGGRELIAVAPGARWETKRWPTESYRAVANELVKSGYGVVLVGSADDAESANEIAAGAGSSIVNLAGSCSILETAAAVRQCRVLVTNDSAALHIAEAVGTPVVALFGPTVAEFGYYPLLAESKAIEVELDCRPCSRNGSRPCPLGTKECLTDIPAQRVIDAVRAVLTERVPARGASENRGSRWS